MHQDEARVQQDSSLVSFAGLPKQQPSSNRVIKCERRSREPRPSRRSAEAAESRITNREQTLRRPCDRAEKGEGASRRSHHQANRRNSCERRSREPSPSRRNAEAVHPRRTQPRPNETIPQPRSFAPPSLLFPRPRGSQGLPIDNSTECGTGSEGGGLPPSNRPASTSTDGEPKRRDFFLLIGVCARKPHRGINRVQGTHTNEKKKVDRGNGIIPIPRPVRRCVLGKTPWPARAPLLGAPVRELGLVSGRSCVSRRLLQPRNAVREGAGVVVQRASRLEPRAGRTTPIGGREGSDLWSIDSILISKLSGKFTPRVTDHHVGGQRPGTDQFIRGYHDRGDLGTQVLKS